MEYLEGQNLHQILKQRDKLAIAEAVDIMEQVASGLAAAHREGIIHRDLKPANIMRDKNGRVVVMDFGLARTFSGDGMTRTGAMLGTVEYMSPNRRRGWT
jgi:serine/threonine protein kinase